MVSSYGLPADGALVMITSSRQTYRADRLSEGIGLRRTEPGPSTVSRELAVRWLTTGEPGSIARARCPRRLPHPLRRPARAPHGALDRSVGAGDVVLPSVPRLPPTALRGALLVFRLDGKPTDQVNLVDLDGGQWVWRAERLRPDSFDHLHEIPGLLGSAGELPFPR